MTDAFDDGSVIEISCSEPARFSELFDRHYSAVRDFCARRVAAHEIDDIAGETFCRAFQHRARFAVTRRDARPWLYGIALNVIRVEQRSFTRGAHATARESAHRGVTGDPSSASADAIDAGRELAIVERALPSLPLDEAEVLLMFVWDELSYDEIAQAMNVPIGTVRSRLFRARQRLRNALEAAHLCRSDS